MFHLVDLRIIVRNVKYMIEHSFIENNYVLGMVIPRDFLNKL